MMRVKSHEIWLQQGQEIVGESHRLAPGERLEAKNMRGAVEGRTRQDKRQSWEATWKRRRLGRKEGLKRCVSE